MKLRGQDFPNVWCAPGARGFFGEAYPFHRLAKLLGMTWKGTGFVAKTTTLDARAGNMPLKDDGITPKQLHPKCIKVYWRSGHVLNAVGLSGPGASRLFETGKWHRMSEPFMLSFMTVANEKAERLSELRAFCTKLRHELQNSLLEPSQVALQLNFACPNTGHDLAERYAELQEMLDICADLGIPIVVNFNALVPIEVIMIAQNHDSCDAVWIGNTLPWGSTNAVRWSRFALRDDETGETVSPLKHLGGGGLSGPVCLPYTIAKIQEARQAGFTKPIIGGNGVQTRSDVRGLGFAGATGVALGVVGMVRPWRMRGIINEAHWQFD